MNTDTRRPLMALAAALAADPEACRELHIYGHMPIHIADAVADLGPEEQEAL